MAHRPRGGLVDAGVLLVKEVPQMLLDGFNDYYARQVQRVAELYPALMAAVPPAPCAPMESGKVYSLSAKEIWRDLTSRVAAGECAFRCPAESVHGLVPIHSSGYCLEPIFFAGGTSWIDPSIPAQDGDFVVVKWDRDTLAEIVERGARSEAWLQVYGRTPPVLAGKLLKEFAGEYWLLTNDSALPLGRNRILGVMRRRVRNGVPLQAPCASQIDPYATTDALLQASFTDYTLPSGFDNSEQVANSVTFIPTMNGEVKITAAFAYGIPGGGSSGFASQVRFVLRDSGGMELAGTTRPIHATADAFSGATTPCTMTLSRSVVGGATYRAALLVKQGVNGTKPGYGVRLLGQVIRVEVNKR